MLDLIVRGGTVVTAFETFQADIGVTDEKISHIAEAGSLDSLIGEHTRVIDAGGKYVMLGLIEPHMHVKAPLQQHHRHAGFLHCQQMRGFRRRDLLYGLQHHHKGHACAEGGGGTAR